MKTLGNKIRDLFRTPKYRKFAKELSIPAFHQGGCLMVARALKNALKGEIWAVASYSQTQDDWALEHYIVKVGEWFIDSTGAYKQRQVIRQVMRGCKAAARLQPVKSKWPNDGLWEGIHPVNERIVNEIEKDVRQLATL